MKLKYRWYLLIAYNIGSSGYQNVQQFLPTSYYTDVCGGEFVCVCVAGGGGDYYSRHFLLYSSYQCLLAFC